METNQTEEGNRLIAEFLKGKHPFIEDINVLRYPFTIDKLHFHDSWDWIIPACNKFCELPRNSKRVKNHFADWLACKSLILNNLGTFNIMKVFNSLVQSIQWYNTQNSQTK